MTDKHVETNESEVENGSDFKENTTNGTAVQSSLSQILSKTQVSSLFSLAAFGTGCLALIAISQINNKVGTIDTDLNVLSVAVKPVVDSALENKDIVSNDIKPVYPTDSRTITVAATTAKRGVSIEDAQDYLKDVSRQVYQDEVLTLFMQNVAALGAANAMVKASAGSITLYGTWKIDIDENNKALLESFPREPVLVVDNESIPFPTCPDGTEEHIVFTQAYKIGSEGWDTKPVIHKDPKLRRWTFMFDEERPLSTDSFDQRLLVLPNCRVVEAKNE